MPRLTNANLKKIRAAETLYLGTASGQQQVEQHARNRRKADAAKFKRTNAELHVLGNNPSIWNYGSL